jgi:O-antigen/teichoic acid export membrane protein
MISKFNFKSELIYKGASAFFMKIVGILFSFLFYWIISKQVGADGNGIYFITIAILNITVLISLKGLNTAFLKYTSKLRKNSPIAIIDVKKKAFAYILPISILFNIIVFFSSNFIACELFNNCDATFSIRIISFAILPLSLCLFIAEGFRGLKKIKFYELINSSLRFIFGSILLVIFFLFNTKINPSLSITIGIFFTLIFSFFYWNKIEKKIKKSYNKKYIKVEKKEIFKLSNPLFFASAISYITNWSDTILLGILSATSDVGVYNIAFKIAMLAKLPLLSINAIAAPKFAETFDLNKNKKIIQDSSRIIFFTSLPVLIVIILFNNDILSLFGNEFTQGSILLVILCIGQLFASLSGSVGHYLQMTDGEKTYKKGVIISLIINLVLNISFIPLYGIIGAGFANISSIIFRQTYFIYKIYQRDKIITLYIPEILKKNDQ